MVCGSCVGNLSRSDILQVNFELGGRTLSAVYMVMQNCVHNVNEDNVEPIWTYIERLPKEVQTSAMTSCLKKTNGTLLNSDKLNKWIANNRALVAETVR